MLTGALGLPDKAEPHLKAALDLRLRVYGPDHVEVARSLLDYGWNLYECEEPREAETRVREALAIHRKVGLQNGATIEILSMLQLCLNAQYRYKEAEEVAQEILVIARQQPDPQPEVANVLHRLAYATIMQGDPVKAERLARESVALQRKLHRDNHPETAWGLYGLAWVLRDQKKFDEAEAYYREALTIFRKQYDDTHDSVSQTLNGLRYVLTAKGDQAGLKRLNAESAVRMSETIARAKYDDLQLRIYRGKLEHDFGDLDKAIAEFSAVLANKSDMVKIWQIRGDCYLRKGEFTKAAEDFTEAIKLKPQEWWYWHERAYAYMMLGEHEKSIADLTQAIELSDHDAAQWLRRGHSYLALGQLDKAEADYTRAIEMNSSYWENWYSRGQLYAELGQWDKAEADLANAVKHCSGDPYQNELAWRLATNADPRLWNPQATVELAEKAVDAAPQNGAYLKTLGVAQYRASQFQKSIASLERSMELRNGGDSVDWFFLAMAHWQLADKEEARKWYDKAVEWMDKNQPNNKDLRRFRREAEELLAGKPAADANTETRD